MKREFIINIILLFFINFLIKPVYIFGVDARIQNLVGTEGYGLYFYYFNFVFLFQFINDPGLQNWSAQYVPKNRDSLHQYAVNLFKIKSILAGLFIIITCLTAWLLGYQDIKMVFFLCLNMILSSFFLLLRGMIAGLGHYRADSLFSSLDKLFMIIIIGYLSWFSVYKENFHISILIYGQGISYFLACTLAAAYLFKRISFNTVPLDFVFFKKVIKWSSPYILILFFMTTYNKLDGVMLGYMLDDNHYQAGVYASAYRFYDAANMVGYLFAALLLPMFAANLNNKDTLEELKSIGLRLTSATALLIVCSIFFYGDEILVWLYKAYEVEFFHTLKFLVLSYFMMAVAYIFGTLLVATGRVGRLNVLFGSGLVINVILNSIFIPVLEAKGAAIATLLTQTAVMFGQVFLARKEIGVGITFKEVLNFSFYALAVVIVFNISYGYFEVHWPFKLTICILICLLLSFVFRIIGKKEVFSLIKKN